MKNLETERLVLRKFKIDDAEAMFNNWASDKETTKYVSFNPHKNIEETRAIISNWINEYEKGNYNWVVELKDTNEIIGNISVLEISEKHNNCEIGYVYGSKYWGKGYGTEALRKVIYYLLVECKFHLIEAKYHSSNPASGRIMEKSGMIKDCVLRERRKNKINPDYDDLIIYSITRKEL